MNWFGFCIKTKQPVANKVGNQSQRIRRLEGAVICRHRVVDVSHDIIDGNLVARLRGNRFERVPQAVERLSPVVLIKSGTGSQLGEFLRHWT